MIHNSAIWELRHAAALAQAPSPVGDPACRL